MPDLNGVQVTIVSNDQLLEEYEITYEGDTATCWIPSEAGKVRTSTQILPLSVDRQRSSFEGGPAIWRSTDDTLWFRLSKFGGGFSQDYPYIMRIEFLTAIWMDEA